MLKTALHGFLMALADSVPGVSGGTVAFILGFYDSFIGSVNRVIYGGKKEKMEGFHYLAKLLVGWSVGMIAAVLVLTSVFEKNIYEVSSLFLGFVFPSVLLIVKDEKECLKGKWKESYFVLAGIVVVVLLTVLNGRIQGLQVNMSQLTVISAVYLFLSGAVAIMAMFLPGISGSTVLLIAGVYVPVMTAVKELLHLNMSVLPMLMIFGMGILAGALGSVRGIQKCLEKHRSKMILFIIGMLLGSLYAIAMGPVSVSETGVMLNWANFSFLFFIIGMTAVAGMELLKREVK